MISSSPDKIIQEEDHQEVFPFEREFRIRVLSCMAQSLDFLRRLRSLLDPKYFEDEGEQEVAKQILIYFDTHNTLPSEEEIFEAIRTSDPFQMEADNKILLKSLLQSAFSKQITSVDFVAERIIDWLQTQEFKQAVLDSLVLIQKGEFRAIKTRMEEALQVGAKILDQGIPYFAASLSRLRKDTSEHITSGLNGLDRCTSGGLAGGELGVILAPPNRGKSLFLINLVTAAIAGGYRAVHYTLELSALKVARRYDANFLKVPYNDVPQHLRRLSKFLRVVRQMVGDNLIIKEFPTKACTVDDIKVHLEQLAMFGFYPDLIVVDYADIMLSLGTNYKEKRHEQGAIYEQLRRLGCEWNLPVWTASQANRASLSKKTITIEDIAESFEKAAISDLIVALCETGEEKKEGKMRLFIAKSRDNISQVTIPVEVDTGRMSVRDAT